MYMHIHTELVCTMRTHIVCGNEKKIYLWMYVVSCRQTMCCVLKVQHAIPPRAFHPCMYTNKSFCRHHTQLRATS